MSLERKIFQDFSADGHSTSHDQTFREGGGSVSQHHRLVILSLGLLNAALLIAAVVIGIYCAKDNYPQVPDSAATPLLTEMTFLRNQTGIVKAKVDAQRELAKKRASHVGLKLELKHEKQLSDRLQREIESLREQKIKLNSNRTALEGSCGRCQPGWVFLKSSCYYFSSQADSNTKKNWLDSQADCARQGGHLLVINNLEEQQIINDNFPRQSVFNSWWNKGFWIGLTDVALPGTWVWVDNVTLSDATYWRTGQPNHQGAQSGNCAAFYGNDEPRKAWYNGNCQGHLLHWICEKEPSQT